MTPESGDNHPGRAQSGWCARLRYRNRGSDWLRQWWLWRIVRIATVRQCKAGSCMAPTDICRRMYVISSGVVQSTSLSWDQSSISSPSFDSVSLGMRGLAGHNAGPVYLSDNHETRSRAGQVSDGGAGVYHQGAVILDGSAFVGWSVGASFAWSVWSTGHPARLESGS